MAGNNQQDGIDIKGSFNIAYFLCIVHSRGIVGVMRNNWGKEALGLPAALAAVMMFVWAGLSGDLYMWAWVGVWVFCCLKNKAEATKAFARGDKVHSHYDGWPRDAMKFFKTESKAKLIGEPVLVAISAAVMWWFYQIHGWPTRGLPSFLAAGVFTLPFVERVKQMVMQRRIGTTMDARLEQEQLVEGFYDKYGRG